MVSRTGLISATPLQFFYSISPKWHNNKYLPLFLDPSILLTSVLKFANSNVYYLFSLTITKKITVVCYRRPSVVKSVDLPYSIFHFIFLFEFLFFGRLKQNKRKPALSVRRKSQSSFLLIFQILLNSRLTFLNLLHLNHSLTLTRSRCS